MTHRLGQILRWTGTCLGEAAYPRSCEVCQTRLDETGWLCKDCHEELQGLTDHPACAQCGAPLALEDAPCPWCAGAGLYPLGRIGRLGTFDEPLRDLIHTMKYSQRWPLAERLGRILCEKSQVCELAEEAQVIVPVPLHWWRRLRRGYNQADVIARVIGRHFGRRVATPVARVRNTPTQTQISAQADRRANVKDAFALFDQRKIAGQRVLLVDDVMTTGATLCETARCMLWAEPAGISAVVLAVADPKHRGFARV